MCHDVLAGTQPMVAQQMLRCADGAHRGHMRWGSLFPSRLWMWVQMHQACAHRERIWHPSTCVWNGRGLKLRQWRRIAPYTDVHWCNTRSIFLFYMRERERDLWRYSLARNAELNQKPVFCFPHVFCEIYIVPPKCPINSCKGELL